MKKVLYIISLIVLQYACSSDGNETAELQNPLSADLIFPHNNSLCNEGTNITPTQSTVLFEWKASKNTDNYSLELKNIKTGTVTSHLTSETQIPIVLERATQYAWYVVSKSNSVEATSQSEVWQFYNAGDGSQNFVPFPAQILYPAMAETISQTTSDISLEWSGSDLDDDITGYDLYFGTENPPALFSNDLSESTLTVPVSTATIYYWYIITKDATGNTSNSGTYQFKIK